jgi:hypothetical protein
MYDEKLEIEVGKDAARFAERTAKELIDKFTPQQIVSIMDTIKQKCVEIYSQKLSEATQKLEELKQMSHPLLQ